MATVESRPPVQPGEPAPDFTLPAADREGSVSLADYRGRSALFLALFRGLYCPLCRRNIVQMGQAREKLQAVGVEMLGVVATKPEHARLYFRFHPARPAGRRPGHDHPPGLWCAEAPGDAGTPAGLPVRAHQSVR